MSQHNEVGKIGEDLAREYLKKQGYKIIEQNYKTKYAEIDLIAEKSAGFLEKNKLVFVEVRTKIGENFGSPEDTLKQNKLKKVLQNSLAYSGFKKWQGPCQIDAICIVLKSLGRSPTGEADYTISRLTHHENIIS